MQSNNTFFIFSYTGNNPRLYQRYLRGTISQTKDCCFFLGFEVFYLLRIFWMNSFKKKKTIFLTHPGCPNTLSPGQGCCQSGCVSYLWERPCNAQQRRCPSLQRACSENQWSSSEQVLFTWYLHPRMLQCLGAAVIVQTDLLLPGSLDLISLSSQNLCLDF